MYKLPNSADASGTAAVNCQSQISTGNEVSSLLPASSELPRCIGSMCCCEKLEKTEDKTMSNSQISKKNASLLQMVGVEVRVTPSRTEIIILATRTQHVLGEKGRRIRELTSVVQKRFNFPEGSVELYAEKVAARGLCAIAQCESLRYKLIGGLAVRRACYGVLRFIMESGAK
ncbi:40S ribosomal protein S3-A, partial [Caerostris extrusa]